jgi:1,2-diacylglycerol 3-beta-galactosyltransferase
MSDTGGGHRAACNAIIAALEARHPGGFQAELLDMWREGTPWPFNRMPELYGPWVNTHPQSYEAQYWLNDRLMKNSVASRAYQRNLYPKLKKLFPQHPADLIVCAHSVFVRPALYALEKLRITTPMVTVVTDYALPPVLWYDPRAVKTLVPTPPAFERGLELGIPKDRLVLTGPVLHPRFTEPGLSKLEARAELGWNPDAKVGLLVGGGDGMGPLQALATAIDDSQADLELVVVAGRNETLKRTLEARVWRKPVRVIGYTKQMDTLMRAADLMITKAGPASITESAALGIPMVLYGGIKHQETPNAEYVVAQNAGIYAPSVAGVVEAVERITKTPGELERLERGVRGLAVPDAIWRIADEIWAVVEGERRKAVLTARMGATGEG